jgi:hypothetical protein
MPPYFTERPGPSGLVHLEGYRYHRRGLQEAHGHSDGRRILNDFSSGADTSRPGLLTQQQDRIGESVARITWNATVKDVMNSESPRIADQLRRAFAGDPWHGSPLRDLLATVSAEQAAARPLPSAHTIWELVLHIEIYVNAAADAVQGIPVPRLFGTEKDWPGVTDSSATQWNEAVDRLHRSADRLGDAITQFTDAQLQDTVLGRDYDFYYLFHGIVQHSLYHGGQIAMLKKAVSRSLCSTTPSA